MAKRISDEEILRPVYEIPDEGSVRGCLVRDHRGFVELQDGLGRFALLPE
jgi:hypothetical protein